MTDDPYRVLREARSHKADPDIDLTDPRRLAEFGITRNDCICLGDALEPNCPYHNMIIERD